VPLLARATLGLGLSLALGSGCFSEPEGESSGATDGVNDTGSTGDNTSAETVDPDDTGDPSAGGCMGCLDAAGGCLAGNLDQACGALAAMCVACDEDAFCDEGQCFPLPDCTPDNCDGCCDGDDCLLGTEPSACGADGQQCAECPSESTCNEASCELPCESTCDGCCDASGDCIPVEETDSLACGNQGGQCQQCAEGFSCSEGTCISTVCAMTCDGCCDEANCLGGGSVEACGQGGTACEPCPAGTECDTECVATPGALWDVVIGSAQLPATLPDGSFWDSLAGAPDPFVQFDLGDASGETSVADDTYIPEWDEVVVSGLTTEQLLEEATYTIRDADVIGSQLAGACSFAIPPGLFGVEIEVTCLAADSTELWTLQFGVFAAG